MRIGIVQTGHAPDVLKDRHGNYPRMFELLLGGRGFEFETWQVVDMEFPLSVRECDGWLITGSRHGVYEHHPFIPPLEAFIREAFAAHVPLVGICFGHQIVAQALGGRVEKFTGGWSVGPTEYAFVDGRNIRLNAWHQDQVVELPPGATTLASNPRCRHAALVYDQRAFTVQAHPEFANDFIAGLIETRGRGLVPDDLLDTALAQFDLPLDQEWIADEIATFLRTAASAKGTAA